MLYRLAYFSHSLLPRSDSDPETELNHILLSARRNNAEQRVTGALLSTGRFFAQVLEGEEENVKSTYQVICRDPRHERLTILTAGPIDERQFGRWSMAHISDNTTAQDVVNQLAMNLPHSLGGESAKSLLSIMGDAVSGQVYSATGQSPAVA